MTLAARRLLGPFEILEPLGAGGMGEVYRARDSRLNREVAVKVLPASLSTDPQRLQRFEQEARAAATLNHPNILAVYDVGSSEGAPYIVSELLDGETLRTRLQPGPLPIRKAIDYALQIARGLAAAHDKGIVHRDLKPDNIFITRDGQVKILDFGLAKLTRPDLTPDAHTMTAFQSEAGTVLGTVGYMSPEQVRGKPTDARSDLFTFGVILYEMISGRRAFEGESAAETMSAIVRDDPPDLSASNRNVPPALEHIVRHCLEKSPGERFQSARDIAFDLELVSQASSTGIMAPKALERRHRSLGVALAAAVLVLAALAGAYWLGARENASVPVPAYHQLTFRRGYLSSARFAPDGQSILYSAAWDGGSGKIYSSRVDSRNSLPLGLENAELLAISSTGEVAVLTDVHTVVGWSRFGTLARTGLTGGTPRPVLDRVSAVAWTPDGRDMAVIRYSNQHYRLEYPLGKVLVETTGWLSDPVFLPDGNAIAYADHPLLGDDRGSLAVVDLQGHSRVLAADFASIQGIAWHPRKKEIWFTASDSGIVTALRSATLSGQTRVLNRAPGRLQLQDIASDGRVLLTQMSGRRGITIQVGNDITNADAALLDWSVPRALSADQQYLLFSEQGDGGGPQYSLYLRRIGTGGDVVRLSDGDGSSISPDDKWAFGYLPEGEGYLVPIGAGEKRKITLPGLKLQYGRFAPDGKALILTAVDKSNQTGVYLYDLGTNALRSITPPGYFGDLISPDGKSVLVSDGEKTWLFSISGGTPRELTAITKDLAAQAWAADNHSVFAITLNTVPARVYRVDLNTGRRDQVREFAPPDRNGIVRIDSGLFSADGHTSVFGFVRLISDLYVMDATQ